MNCIKKISILLVFIYFGINIYSVKFEVISNPKPNLIEKDYKELKKVGEISDEVGEDSYLFYPYSMTMDKYNNLYVYDKMQAKILIFNDSFKYIKSFGSKGQGPGEFFGEGKGCPVFINIGLNGNIYANDLRAFKVSVFNRDGGFIRQFRFKTRVGISFKKPISDVNGNMILQEFRKDRLVVFNEKGITLFSLPHKDRVKEILFKENKPLLNRYNTKSFERLIPFRYDPDELVMKLTLDSKLLLYFSYSSTMVVVNLKTKESNTFRIWPKEAIEYRKKIEMKAKYGYGRLFPRMFLDRDRDDIFYLDFGRRNDKSIQCIYKLNIVGELTGVMYIKVTDPSLYTRFLLKQNKLFIAKQEEKIFIYKEE
jgi:hypothetical protein